MFSRVSLKKKLLFLCSLLSALSILIGVTGYLGFENVIESYDQVASDSLPNVRISEEMFLNFRRIRIDLRTLGLPGISKEQAQQAINEVKEATGNYEELDRKYRELPFAPGEKEIYEDVAKEWTNFKKIGEQVVSLYETGKPEDFQKMISIFFTECPASAKAYTNAMSKVVAFHTSNADQWVAKAKSTARQSTQLSILIIVLGTIVGMTTGFVFANSISKSILAVSEDLARGAEEVTQASSQISASASGVSQAATEQASSLEETVATMEEITSMIQLNTENAKQASRVSNETREIAAKGESEIHELITAIQEISADSRKIEEITNVIDDIAFQTNLLALNAAVEAARAGEQGKGFAVVAEAVRNLAQRSSVAAKDISTLIEGSVSKIEEGSRKAAQSGKVLNEIVNSVKKVSDLNSEIANASEEQSHGVSQINQAMNQLDQVTQQNASSAEEAASASEELASQASALQESVANLKGVVEGSSQDFSHSSKNRNSILRKSANLTDASINSIQKAA